MALKPITQLINDWRSGADGAEEKLLKMVYPAMKEIAGRQLRQAKQFTLRPTELANDVFMQMRKTFGQDTENSTQFYALAAHMIRCPGGAALFYVVEHQGIARMTILKVVLMLVANGVQCRSWNQRLVCVTLFYLHFSGERKVRFNQQTPHRCFAVSYVNGKRYAQINKICELKIY